MTPGEVAEHGTAGHVMTVQNGIVLCVTCAVRDAFRRLMTRPVRLNEHHEIIPWAIAPGAGDRVSPAELRLYEELMADIVAEDTATTVATIRVLSIPVDDTLPVIVRTVPRDFESFRTLVDGGWLEVSVPADNAWTVWVDEDGISKDLPLNWRATKFAHANGWGAPSDYRILGSAFFTGPADDAGETLPVPEYVLAVAAEFFKGEFTSE